MRNLQLFSLLTIFVLLLAACGGSGGSEAPSGPPPAKDVTLEGPNELKFIPDEITAQVGQQINITLNNTGALEHNFLWADTEEEVINTKGGESASTSRTFDTAGEYDFFCTVPGHKEAGMIGKVVVK